MTDNTAVPLNTARKPGVANCKISKADNVVCINDVTLLFLIIKFPKPAAEIDKKFGIHIFIFKHGNINVLLFFVKI